MTQAIRRSITATRVNQATVTGSAPRSTHTAQTIPAKQSGSVTQLAALNRHGQLPQATAPIRFSNRTQTAQVSPTAILRSAPTQTHPSTTLPQSPVFASMPSTPIVLRGFGSMRGTSKQHVVMPPPQPTVPNYARKIVRNG